jgi:rubrerythrin
VEEVLNNLGAKKFWRCNACNDLCVNIAPPQECPTCQAKNAYLEIELSEFKKILELLGT